MPNRLPTTLEHVPVASYHLLRRLDEGAVDIATLFGTDDGYAVRFLVSRKLASLSGNLLEITAGGRAIGEIREDRGLNSKDAFAAILASPFSNRPFDRSFMDRPKRLSETLEEAAQNIGQLSRAHVLILMRQAVKALKLGEDDAHELVDAANDDAFRSHIGH